MSMFKHPLLWVTIALVGMFGVAGVLGKRDTTERSPSGIQTAEKTEQAKGQQGSADRAGTYAGAFNDERQPREYEPDCSKSENADLCAQRRMAKAAEEQIGLNVGGLILLFFTLLATGVAAFYARRAALAARSTVAVMEDTAERQLRAYIFVDSISLADASQIAPIPASSGTEGDLFVAAGLAEGVPKTRPRGIPGVHWTIKNSGQTPAYEVVHWGLFDVLPVSQEHTAVVPTFPPDALETYIAPGGSNTNQGWYPRTLTEQEMADIRAGVRAVYVFGRVEYRDAFKRKRTTEYRLKYTHSAYPPVGPTTFNYCVEGNKAD